MIIGLFLLIFFWIQIWRDQSMSLGSIPVENIGLYWHFVDVIWVFLFPLLYLIDRSHGGAAL